MSEAAHDVAVWQAGLDQPLDPGLLGALAPEERARAARFAHPGRRQAYQLARALLRHVLAGELGTRPDDLRFELGPHGKPELRPAADIHFNLSHSGKVVVLAVSRRVVGVDVEQLRPGLDHHALAERFFSLRERRQLARVAPPARRAAFFATWTRKEAVLKAWGVGLSLPLDSFDVSVPGSGPPAVLAVRRGPGAGGRWSLHDLDAGPGYAGAVAVAGPPGALHWRPWPSPPTG
ncbi:MAG TPA: 4'-phosphopantetheinyl transferase superfamily protein [Acidimicrobiales bacterium]|jgi:4'-phosphopantetheinyl transferase|nr:4'-phosphopantetheinyl transferase superfamily protein [Acidimicrobiales bacterium]